MTNTYWPTVTQPDALGWIFGADDVRDAVNETVLTWAPYYIGVLSQRLSADNLIGGRNQNPNPLPNFGTWVNEPSFRSIGTGQPAAFMVRVLSAESTDVQGQGRVAALYRCQVELQVWGTDWQEASDLTSWYEKVLRWCILQHRSLGIGANATKWISTEYGAVEHSSTRTEGQALLVFTVALLNTINVRTGPGEPIVPPAPPPVDYTVETILIELTKYPVTEDA